MKASVEGAFRWLLAILTRGMAALKGEDIATLLGHQMVRGIQRQRNNGLLGVLQEGAHDARGETATVATGGAATGAAHLEGGV